jgi:DNA-binding NtrC family response regulator
MTRVAIYSEDHALQPLLSTALGDEYEILLESSGEEMDSLIAAGGCDVMILDLCRRQDSLETRIAYARRLIASSVPAILMADDGLRSTAFELVRAGAFGYTPRPPSIRDLKTLLSRACETSALRQQLCDPPAGGEAADRCDRIIGSSANMQRVYQLIRSVTNLNATVLVTGESGTGKELIARGIHNLGARADKPFVAVSCGAIPETLIEAELFGHEKGAFTGTVGAREGYFERAQDGTLFLDELGDLSVFTQVKLLRVLQQMEFSRLGSTRLVPLRARLIFATHQDLAKLVAEGKFRQDLYYRINVMRIESPALRDRAEDITLIAGHFLRHYAGVFQKPMDAIDPEALEILQSYRWPGNVRELENVMQRAIILAPGRVVRAEDLVLSLDGQDERGVAFEEVLNIADYRPAGSFERQLRDYKIRLAVTAVREAKGNKTVAARSLSISRAYLHRLLRLAEADAEAAFSEQPLRGSVTA